MARITLRNRLRRLEQRRDEARIFRVLTYVPGSPVMGTPLHARRIMLAPNFGSDAEWESASIKQQRTLVSQAKGETPMTT